MDYLKDMMILLFIFHFSIFNCKSLGGYYASWANQFSGTSSENGLKKIAPYIKYVLISYVDPSFTYEKGSYSFNNSGLQFTGDFQAIKNSIQAAKRIRNQTYILSIGGPNNLWYEPNNISSFFDLAGDLGVDGIDINFSSPFSCKNIDTAMLNCTTDYYVINIIKQMRYYNSKNLLITASTNSLGAYGSQKYPNSKYGPISVNAGLWVNPLLKCGDLLDAIFINSYDAGSEYSARNAFLAYSDLLLGKKTMIFIGIEIPPESFGDKETNPNEAKDLTEFVLDNGGEGAFIMYIQKKGRDYKSKDYYQPLCNLVVKNNCDLDPIY